jgi:hypothetical protein
MYEMPHVISRTWNRVFARRKPTYPPAPVSVRSTPLATASRPSITLGFRAGTPPTSAAVYRKIENTRMKRLPPRRQLDINFFGGKLRRCERYGATSPTGRAFGRSVVGSRLDRIDSIIVGLLAAANASPDRGTRSAPSRRRQTAAHRTILVRHSASLGRLGRNAKRSSYTCHTDQARPSRQTLTGRIGEGRECGERLLRCQRCGRSPIPVKR